MRHRGPSKQRLWLGTGRHLCCGGRRYTDADADSHGDSDRHANSHGDGDRHGDSNRHADRHANGQPHCNSIGNSHATTDANTQSWAISKATPHASAQTIEFPYWKFLVLGHRCSSSVEEIADRMLHAPSFVDGLSRLVHLHRA